MGHVACCELLQISERTLRNWESGATRIPYAAYKLLRVLKGGKHLGAEWHGFHVWGGVLHTPEGHRFKFSELVWWSLLVRRARAFSDVSRHGESVAAAARKPTPRSASDGDGLARPSLAGVASDNRIRPLAATIDSAATATVDPESGLPTSNRGVSETEQNRPQAAGEGCDRCFSGGCWRLQRPSNPSLPCGSATVSLVWFRRWYALAVLLRLPRKRAFLRMCQDIDADLVPLWNAWYRLRNPAMYLRVRRLAQLMRAGRWEIEA